MPAPEHIVVYRIQQGTFRSDVAGSLVMDLEIQAGYLNDSNEFVKLSILKHTMSPQGVADLFTANPNNTVTRIEDLTTALGTYLLTNAIIDGALVS